MFPCYPKQVSGQVRWECECGRCILSYCRGEAILFIGHYAVAFAAKKAAPKTSLGTLITAAAFLDLLWPVFLLLGFEEVKIAPGITRFTPLDFTRYPYSHSLLMSLVWGALFGGSYYALTRYRAGAIAVGVLVPSHWVLDFVAHRPDLPLTPWGAERYGLGLWNSVPATLAVEFGLLAAGVWLYIAATKARDRIGSLGLVGFLVFILAMYAGAAFGPPPPSAEAIAWSDMGQWLVVLLAAWIDRHRAAQR
jgi:hypothetical protein